MFGGLEVVLDTQLGLTRKQVRFPRSKRKRVRKKWRRDPRNWVSAYEEPIVYEIRPPAPVAGEGWWFARGLLGSRPMLICNPPGKRLIEQAIAMGGEA